MEVSEIGDPVPYLIFGNSHILNPEPKHPEPKHGEPATRDSPPKRKKSSASGVSIVEAQKLETQ